MFKSKLVHLAAPIVCWIAFFLVWLVLSEFVKKRIETVPLFASAADPSITKLIATALVVVASIAISVLVARAWARLHRFSLADIGLMALGWSAIWGLVIGIAANLTVFACAVALGWLQIVGVASPMVALTGSGLILMTSLGAAVTEEIAFRGVPFKAARIHWGKFWWVMVILSSLLFGALHLPQLKSTYPVIVLLYVTLGGLLFSAAWYIDQSLWLPIGVHFGFDLSVGLLALEDDLHSPLVTRFPGSRWVIGEDFQLWMPLIVIALSLLICWLMKTRQRAKVDIRVDLEKGAVGEIACRGF